MEIKFLILFCILITGCSCNQYAEREVCTQTGIVDEKCVNKVVLYIPENYTKDSIDLQLGEGLCLKEEIEIETIIDSTNKSNYKFEYIYNGTQETNKCISYEKRFVCIN